ncbi:MAG: ECF transporter S component [Candidatus Muiribacteriota bacterium]|jgi:riboflavin transporter FmnP
MAKKPSRLLKIVLCSVFSSLAFVLMLFEIPFFGAFTWLKYDISDVSLLLVGFKLGPLFGIISVFLRNILFWILKGDGYGIFGFVMSTVAGLSFILPPVIFYNRKKSMKNAYTGLVLGILSMVFIMIPLNIYIAKIMLNMENTKVISYIIYGVAPFNFLKGILNSIFVVIIYKKIWKIIGQEKTADEKN